MFSLKNLARKGLIKLSIRRKFVAYMLWKDCCDLNHGVVTETEHEVPWKNIITQRVLELKLLQMMVKISTFIHFNVVITLTKIFLHDIVDEVYVRTIAI